MVPAESVPPLVRELGVKRAAEVTYAGPATTSVRVYEMNVPASAFELMQKWRQQDGRAIYTGPYFVVANAAADAGAADLLTQLRKDIKVVN